ncbi:MAG: hypothetical protein KAI84_21440, partial [Gammaproteobacteria bacterium]|nr:hypothetical protein [Gammaproteobacteria bacterium]
HTAGCIHVVLMTTSDHPRMGIMQELLSRYSKNIIRFTTSDWIPACAGGVVQGSTVYESKDEMTERRDLRL